MLNADDAHIQHALVRLLFVLISSSVACALCLDAHCVQYPKSKSKRSEMSFGSIVFMIIIFTVCIFNCVTNQFTSWLWLQFQLKNCWDTNQCLVILTKIYIFYMECTFSELTSGFNEKNKFYLRRERTCIAFVVRVVMTKKKIHWMRKFFEKKKVYNDFCRCSSRQCNPWWILMPSILPRESSHFGNKAAHNVSI